MSGLLVSVEGISPAKGGKGEVPRQERLGFWIPLIARVVELGADINTGNPL
ncbi:MAG: hypothetical protein ACLP8S_04385 [Solirubrobacteraceae bacterium]